MQIIISPARRMQTDTDSFPIAAQPQYLNKTKKILEYLRQLSYPEIRKLW